MRKFVISVLFASTIIGCSNGNEKGNDEKTSVKKEADNALSNNPDYVKGLELYAKNDCSTCHQVKVKIQGPSYSEVAAKYQGDTAMIKVIAQRIIKGSKGVWGDIQMPAHPGLSEADAIALVKYVYLLKE
ncbi:MAG: c-type cytochrome [Chitinophagaceae bacterium]